MLTSHASKAVFYGNGVSTQFPFTFKVWNAEQLLLEVVDAQGIHQPLGSWTAELSDNGGTVHYTHEGSPLPPGYTLAILRNMPFTQEVNLISGTRFDPAVIEAQLDRATAERQQLREAVERSVQVPPTADYTANDILQEIYQAQSESLAHATAAANSEVQAQASANTAASYLHQSHEEKEKAHSEANRAKAEADRAAAEVNVAVDGTTIEKNALNALSTKAYSLQDFPHAPTVQEQKYPASVGAVASILSLPIGTQIAVRCSTTYIPEGCIPEDGTEYSKAQFSDLWDKYLITGLLHTCTYAEADTQIDATGACNAFALNLERETFKAPYTPNGFMVQQAVTDTELGKVYEAGLPNITGTLSSWGTSYGVPLGGSGAFHTQGSHVTTGLSVTTGQPSGQTHFDAARSSIIYGASPSVQPRALALRHFVVVATGSMHASQMDWSAWATGLAGKVNTSQIEYACIINGNTTGASHEVQDSNLGNAGVISANSRYILENPFGNATPVLCMAEVFANDMWSGTGFIFSGGGYGVGANYMQGEGIVVQTGLYAVVTAGTSAGGGHGNVNNLTSASCRIHVWKVRGI